MGRSGRWLTTSQNTFPQEWASRKAALISMAGGFPEEQELGSSIPQAPCWDGEWAWMLVPISCKTVLLWSLFDGSNSHHCPHQNRLSGHDLTPLFSAELLHSWRWKDVRDYSGQSVEI